MLANRYFCDIIWDLTLTTALDVRISNIGVLSVVKPPERDIVGNWRIRAAIAEQLGPLSCILPHDVVGEVILKPNRVFNAFFVSQEVLT